MKYVALLRGINVGGNNIISMDSLRSCFRGLGFRDVATYIQSGNVIFSAPYNAATALEQAIERALNRKYGKTITAVVLSGPQLAEIIREAPAGFGQEAAKCRYDVIFLKPPLTAKEAFKSVSVREGVDEANQGRRALYFSRLIAQASKSRLMRLISLPIYKSLTIRNWNTAKKLAALAGEGLSPDLPGEGAIGKIRRLGYRPEAVGCLLYNHRLLFVYKRAHDLWQLPQGGVEKGENLEAAARREMAEELGGSFAAHLKRGISLISQGRMRIAAKRLNLNEPSQRKSRRLKGKHYYFLALNAGTATLDVEKSEFDGYRWISYAEGSELLKKTGQKGKARIVRKALDEMKSRGLLK